MKLKQAVIWIAALVIGGIFGSLGVGWLNEFMDFIAAGYTKCFQVVAAPTVALAILIAMASLGGGINMGKVFRRTFAYTLITSFVAALVGIAAYILIAPGNLPVDAIAKGAAVAKVQELSSEPLTVYGHILNCIPSNIVKPLLDGNPLPIIVIAASIGLAIAFADMKDENVATLLRCVKGLQDAMFRIIRGLIWALPVGIVAFSAQLFAQLSAGMAVESIGKYVLIVLGCNLFQIFVVLPLFCFLRGVNGYKVMRQMTPALMMALFTKSSAATLPVTVATAESSMRAKPDVARFVLPLCCTINMNGCATFICVTSLFVMQHMGAPLSVPMMVVWAVIAVICAVGNAGVPMGCYFLTLSLMAGQGAPLGILGVILPIYAVIDMVETCENVWSDCCICAVVNKEMK